MMRWYFVLMIIASLLAGCGQKSFTVPTKAMEPTIRTGNHVFVDKTFYNKNPIQRFDIVLVTNPEGKDKTYVKRIIALGGERIEIKGGKILIDGNELRETFSAIPAHKNFGPLVVPEKEYFVLGDNHPNSYDSRYWKDKTVKTEDICGKVIKIVEK